jgi:glucose 1-dehydrogenase
VVLADLATPEAQAAAIRESGGEAMAVSCDVASPEANRAMVESAAARYGRLDALVANAVASRRAPFLEVTPEDLEYTLRTSLYGAFYSCQAAARQLVAQGGGGSLLLITTVHTVRHPPGSIAYNIAKSGMATMTRSLASELAEHRIRVNAILPGWTDTPGERKFATEEQLAEAARHIPFERLAQPSEMGYAARYLLSKEAAYVTGAELIVDGGITLQSGKNF